MLRVGHGGAGAIARGNTLASFEAAVELGVDMIEFDVRAARGRLVLAHTPLDARLRHCLGLDAALRHLSARRYAGVRFNLDIKQPGVEAATLFALERFGLTDRSLISSQIPALLDRFRRLDPSVRTGVSVAGRLVRRRHGWRDWRSAVLDAVARRRFDDVMAHHRLVDERFVEAMRERAGRVFAWTVDDRSTIDRLRAVGASGVVTNDPRLFQPVALTG